MSDERLCCIRGRYIDINAPDIRVLAHSGGGHGRKTTVLDSNGTAHILTTRAMSDKYRPTEVEEKEV